MKVMYNFYAMQTGLRNIYTFTNKVNTIYVPFKSNILKMSPLTHF